MGLDQDPSSALGDLTLPLNSLTWREVVRYCKSLCLSLSLRLYVFLQFSLSQSLFLFFLLFFSYSHFFSSLFLFLKNESFLTLLVLFLLLLFYFTFYPSFRVVLISTVCKDVNMGESDISATIKGKGYFATPETVDRKALKLARKRILFNYTVRDESQEALYGKMK